MKFQGSIVTSNSVIVNIDNKSYTAQKSHPKYVELIEALKVGDADTFVKLLDIPQVINETLSNSGVEVVNGDVLYNGEPINHVVTDVITRMISEGFDFAPMARFLERLMKNPSRRAVDELYGFLEVMGLVITEDGCFLAYKTVRQDFKDKYSGRIDNTPGANGIVRLPRNAVDDNCNNTCSHGYHVGALGYAGPGGWYNNSNDRVVICKVDPADVVSVPVDHSCQKLRCCYYEPIGEFEGELKHNVYSGKLNDNKPVNVERKQKFDSVSINDVLVGEFYTAIYTDKSGVVKDRWFLVEEKNVNDEVLLVELCYPEVNEGELRTFRFEGLSDIRTWNGSYNDWCDSEEQEDNDDWDNEYEDEDEEEDNCSGRYW